MKNVIVALSSCYLLLHQMVFAAPIYFDDMGEANAYIFNDFSASFSDSQGALLVGGNAALEGYSVATLNAWDALALDVRGDLTIVGGDINGLTSIDGTASVSKTSQPRLINSEYLYNQAFFSALADGLSTQAAVSTNLKYGALTALGSAEIDTLFINVNQQLLDSAWGLFTQDVNAGVRVVFNVAGEDVVLSSQKDWLVKDVNYAFNHAANNVLFNFYEAKKLSISGGIYGSILAPNADVVTGHGVLNGQIIANSFAGNIQLNDAPFRVDQPAARVSEPLPFMLFLLGLMGCILMRRYSAHNGKERASLTYPA